MSCSPAVPGRRSTTTRSASVHGGLRRPCSTRRWAARSIRRCPEGGRLHRRSRLKVNFARRDHARDTGRVVCEGSDRRIAAAASRRRRAVVAEDIGQAARPRHDDLPDPRRRARLGPVPLPRGHHRPVGSRGLRGRPPRARALAQLDTTTKNAALMPWRTRSSSARRDPRGQLARHGGRGQAGLTRACSTGSQLDEAAARGIASDVRAIAALPDPVGETIEGFRLANGVDVRRVRVRSGWWRWSTRRART